MPILYSPEGTPVEFSDTEAPLALESGQYGLPDNQDIFVTNRKGDVYKVDPLNAATALKSGWYLETPDETKERVSEKYYGGRGLEAALTGAASALTFGGSSIAARAAGQHQELAEIKKRNEGAYFIGETLGTIAPLIASGGTSLFAKGLQKAGAGVLGAQAAGKAVEKVTAKQLAKFGVSEAAESLGKRVVAKAAPRAAGSALEASFYGAGQAISEEMLGEPEINAEKLMYAVGTRALLAGTIGGAIGASEVTLPLAFKSAQKQALSSIQKVKNWFPEHLQKQADDMIAKGDPQGKIFKELVQKPLTEEGALLRKAAIMSDPERQQAATRLYEGFDEIHQAMEKANRSLQKARPKEMEAILSGKIADEAFDGVNLTKILAENENLITNAKTVVKEMQSQPAKYSQPIAAQLENAVNEFATKLYNVADDGTKVVKFGIKPAEIVEAVNDYKSTLGSLAKFSREISESQAPSVDKVKEVYRLFQQSLENEEVYGLAAARQAAVNRVWSRYLRATGKNGPFRAYFMDKVAAPSGIVYKVSPGKTMTFVRKINQADAVHRWNALEEYYAASMDLLGELDKTLKVAPDPTLDPNALTEFLGVKAKETQKLTGDLIKSKELRSLRGDQVMDGLANLQGQLAQNAATKWNVPGLDKLVEIGSEILSSQKVDKKVNRLITYEKMIMAAEKKLEKSIANIVDVSPKAAKVMAKGKSLSPALAATVANLVSDMDDEEEDSDVKTLRALASNPDLLSQELQKRTSEVNEAAPKIGQEMNRKLMNGITTISADLRDPRPVHIPGSANYGISDQVKAKNKRKLNAVLDASTFVNDLENGTATIDQKKAFEAMYPKLFSYMQERAMTKLSKSKEPLPYHRRAYLSAFLDLPMEPSRSPQMMGRLQSAFSGLSSQPPAQMPTTKAGKLKMDSLTEGTAVQRVSNK